MPLIKKYKCFSDFKVNLYLSEGFLNTEILILIYFLQVNSEIFQKKHRQEEINILFS